MAPRRWEWDGSRGACAVPRLLTNVVGVRSSSWWGMHLCLIWVSICGQTSLALTLFDSLLPILLA